MVPKNILAQFTQWLDLAKEKLGEEQAITTCIATSDSTGKPAARMVLLKKYDERGFVFFTNFNSKKGQELKHNPYAALCLYWQPLDRQIRIEGKVEVVSATEADEYFAARHPRSRVGAIVSKQSKPLVDYNAFVGEVDRLEKAFAGNEIPRPENWSGFRVIPDYIEFWQAEKNRLHQRHLHHLKNGVWQEEMLYP